MLQKILHKALHDRAGNKIYDHVIVACFRDTNAEWARACLSLMVRTDSHGDVLSPETCGLSYIGTHQDSNRLTALVKHVETDLRGRFQKGMRVDSAHGHESLCNLMAEVEGIREKTAAAEDQASARLREVAKSLHFLRPAVTEGASTPALQLQPLSLDVICKGQDLDKQLLEQRALDWPSAIEVKSAEEPTPPSVSKLGGPCRERLSLTFSVHEDHTSLFCSSADDGMTLTLQHRQVVWYHDTFGRVTRSPPAEEPKKHYKLSANTLVVLDKEYKSDVRVFEQLEVCTVAEMLSWAMTNVDGFRASLSPRKFASELGGGGHQENMKRSLQLVDVKLVLLRVVHPYTQL